MGMFIEWIKRKGVLVVVVLMLTGALCVSLGLRTQSAHAAPVTEVVHTSVSGIAGVTQQVVYVTPDDGAAQYNEEDARGNLLYQGDVYFQPTNGTASNEGITAAHPIIEDEYNVATRTERQDITVDNGNPTRTSIFDPGHHYHYQVATVFVHGYDAGFIEQRIPHPNRSTPTYRYLLQVRTNGQYQQLGVNRYTHGEYAESIISQYVQQARTAQGTANKLWQAKRTRNVTVVLSIIAAILLHTSGIGWAAGLGVAAGLLALIQAQQNGVLGLMADLASQYDNMADTFNVLERALGQHVVAGPADNSEHVSNVNVHEEV